MTATVTPARGAQAGQTPSPPARSLATKRTMLTLAASALGIFPLKGLLSDSGWLIDVWLTMLVVIVPAALLRLRREATALDIWPGVVLMIPWLTARFVSDHAWLGFIPTRGSWGDLSTLIDQLHHTTRDEVAPVHSNPAVRLVVCALLGLLAALIDLIAVVGRRGALAGVPLLVVYTVSGAVPRKGVPWQWFVLGAAGFLILLALDAGDDLRSWGRHVPHPGGARSRPPIAVSAQRIAVAAIAAAVLLPVLVPAHPRNLIADAFHGAGIGNGDGDGPGGGSISPFAKLRGELHRTNPVRLFSVNIARQSRGGAQPFYLRYLTLESFDGDGWSESGHGATVGIDDGHFATAPPTDTTDAPTLFEAQVTIEGLTGNAPVFTVPLSIRGLDASTKWSVEDQILSGSGVERGQQITEDVVQPNPGIAQLEQSTTAVPDEVASNLEYPADIPASVRTLLAGVIRGKATPYDRARAISDFFAAPKNGFTYSLETKSGDSGSDLADFLKNREGFCQQYAAAMGVMLRMAGIPARVVLGYEHPLPDAEGDFVVTTDDAHSWVEAYFTGVGWVPFDPTPPAGLSGGAASDLTYAPHHFPKSTTSQDPGLGISKPLAFPGRETSSATTSAQSANRSSAVDALLWVTGLVLVAGLALAPAFVRVVRRRRRLFAARHGDADALWAELSDTAVDLGYVWSPARSPRQVASWLSRDAPAAATALAELASAVELKRYSAARAGDTADDPDALTGELRTVTGALKARRSGRTRLRAFLWPGSLGLGRLPGGFGRRR